MTQEIELFNKTYYGESLYDLSRDMDEFLDPDFNPSAGQIPTDEYGIHRGEFRVTVVWVNYGE